MTLTSGQPFPSSVRFPTLSPPNLQSQNPSEKSLPFFFDGTEYAHRVLRTRRRQLTRYDLEMFMKNQVSLVRNYRPGRNT